MRVSHLLRTSDLREKAATMAGLEVIHMLLVAFGTTEETNERLQNLIRHALMVSVSMSLGTGLHRFISRRDCI